MTVDSTDVCTGNAATRGPGSMRLLDSTRLAYAILNSVLDDAVCPHAKRQASAREWLRDERDQPCTIVWVCRVLTLATGLPVTPGGLRRGFAEVERRGRWLDAKDAYRAAWVKRKRAAQKNADSLDV